MRASDLMTYILGIAGALAGYFLLAPPLSWATIGICAAFALWTLFAADAGGVPLIDYDPLIPTSTATLIVAPVAEPVGVLAAGAAVTGLAVAVRRMRHARTAVPVPRTPHV